MARYIDAEKLIYQLRQNQMWTKSRDLTEAIITVQNQPTADVEKVKHGKWKKSQFSGRSGFYSLRDVICSECGIYSTFPQDNIEHPMFYCPNCGAKMDGGKTE